jgi:hypothetical protein
LKHALIRQCVPIQTLDLTRLVKPQEGKAHHTKVDKLRCRDKRDKPVQHHSGVLAKLQEGQQGDHQDEDDAVEWDSLLCAFSQELGRFAFEGEAEERARGAINVAVSGGESRSQDTGVDDVWETFDAESVHGDDVW